MMRVVAGDSGLRTTNVPLSDTAVPAAASDSKSMKQNPRFA